MTAIERQKEWIRKHLSPILKEWGYRRSGNTWTKDKGEFVNVINIQNYSWNTKDNVDFRFNIGIVIKASKSDEEKKRLSIHNAIVRFDEGMLLPKAKDGKYRNNQGYNINSATDIIDFTESTINDFVSYILPSMDQPSSLSECIDIYGNLPFWGDRLKKEFNMLGK